MRPLASAEGEELGRKELTKVGSSGAAYPPLQAREGLPDAMRCVPSSTPALLLLTPMQETDPGPTHYTTTPPSRILSPFFPPPSHLSAVSQRHIRPLEQLGHSPSLPFSCYPLELHAVDDEGGPEDEEQLDRFVDHLGVCSCWPAALSLSRLREPDSMHSTS